MELVENLAGIPQLLPDFGAYLPQQLHFQLSSFRPQLLLDGPTDGFECEPLLVHFPLGGVPPPWAAIRPPSTLK